MRSYLFFIKSVCRMAPTDRLTIPQAYICQGDQGPCPKKIFDTKAVIAPMTKPFWLPNTRADTIMTK